MRARPKREEAPREPSCRSTKGSHRLTGRAHGSGFTLIEIMVAVLLLLVVLAGMVPLFLQGLSQTSSTRYKSVATNIARERMEQVRELDYREIQTGAQLAARFAPAGATVTGDTYYDTTTLSNATLTVRFSVEDSSSEGEWLKKVTVVASWVAPPSPSPAVVTTLIHQQYLGPRGSWLELTNTTMDPLDTKVPLLSATTTARYHLAQADWTLAYENLDPNSPKNIYLRLYLMDATGYAVNLGNVDDDYKIDKSYLHCTLDASAHITDVYFEYPGFADPTIVSLTPDGYWEMRACAFNEWDQPGNTWRLPCRVETEAPATPTDVIATPYGDNTIMLQWTPGTERDRMYWELFRIKRGEDGVWPAWSGTPLAIVSPYVGQYTDVGDPLTLVDPWGTLETVNFYQYLIRAVDVASNIGPGAASPQVQLPGETTSTTAPTTTTTGGSTTTAASYTVLIRNTTSHDRVFVITKDDDGQEYLRQLLAKEPNHSPAPLVPVSGLPAGTYTVTASRDTQGNEKTDTSKFTLPGDANKTVFYQ